MQRTVRREHPDATAAGEVSAPAFLVLGCMPDTPYEGVLQTLTDAGLSPQGPEAAESLSRGVLSATGHAREVAGQLPVLPPQAAAAFGTPEQWLDQVADAHVLMLFTTPEVAIARAMDNGQVPSEPLQAWCQQAEELLRVFRRNRRRVTLVDVDAATADPAGLVQLLGDRLGVRLGMPPRRDHSQAVEADLVHQAIAALAVRESESAQALHAELEASALPLAESDERGPNSDQVFHSYNAGQGTSAELEALSQEKDALLAQLNEAREQLEKRDTESRDLNEKIRRLEEQARDKDKQIDAETHTQQELREENELLLAQLHQVQEELESYYAGCRDLEAQLQRVYNSTSWRITRPMRAVVLLARGKRRRLRR